MPGDQGLWTGPFGGGSPDAASPGKNSIGIQAGLGSEGQEGCLLPDATPLVGTAGNEQEEPTQSLTAGQKDEDPGASHHLAYRDASHPTALMVKLPEQGGQGVERLSEAGP